MQPTKRAYLHLQSQALATKHELVASRDASMSGYNQPIMPIIADEFHMFFSYAYCFFNLGMVCLQLRRERIAERMKALQELVPNANKVDQNLLSFLLSIHL